ncbi:hypothetical protein [Aquibacillus saliphilus]|uniref:hypothetical protein n=1 Tax=Aquibacillus saliphilus TaxID=1909422 RepID=UPI001CF0B4E5|nr:hypothetical protein [Aquibacillus saliphilus]
MVQKGYHAAGDIKKVLIDNQKQLVENTNGQNYQVYTFLHEQFHSGDTKNNGLFHFVCRSFYNLDNLSVTAEFEQKYFELIERERLNDNRPNIVEITNALYQVKNRNGNPSMKFPLVISMLHLKNPYFPTFDNNVATLFGFTSTNHLAGFNRKMKRLIEQYRHLFVTYQQLLGDSDIINLINQIEKKMNDNKYSRLPKIKKLDLLINEATELLK